MPEGVTGVEALQQAREFIRAEVEPDFEIEAASISSYGRMRPNFYSSETVQGSCRLKFVASEVKASAVMKLAYHLK